ncbi:protein hunchback-like [Leptinotarsa decemlineata]|uniref:protein hunchback-like n=1 Tax=Leptinotarsa decemlineata TaxID=7539 RepID=UPI003D30778D
MKLRFFDCIFGSFIYFPIFYYVHLIYLQDHTSMEQDPRSDSGVPSSPESDRSAGLCFSAVTTSQSTTFMPTAAYYSNPMISQEQFLQHQGSPPHMTIKMDHTPIPSSSSESVTSPKVPEIEEENYFPPVEMTMDNLSSNPNECPAKEDKFKTEKYNNDVEKYVKELGIPQKNSNGKVKTHKCKHCPFIATTKLDFWKHIKTHMRGDRIFTCPKCPFVTELKHHLKYHMRNHDGSKPYKCSQCDYSCVNNSMLNSHKKSHSNIYQFRCADCEYATKYAHSLKLHLRKLKHSPAMVLNADGTPNPLQVIDVYGTRRGPKLKPQSQKRTETTTSDPEPIITFPFNPLMPYSTPSVQDLFPALFPIFADLQNPKVLENLKRLVHESSGVASEPSTSQTIQAEPHTSRVTENKVSDMDMSFAVEPPSNDESSKDEEDDNDDECVTTMFENVEAVLGMNPEDDINTVTNDGNQNSCQFCDLTFGDPIMYTIHMGYHGFNNPFTCNMCGEKCGEKLAFYVHIARQSHM